MGGGTFLSHIVGAGVGLKKDSGETVGVLKFLMTQN